MKKSVIALALCCLASGAYAQLGGGVVGSLGANGAASRAGGLGSGITTGTTMRGEDLRQTGQLAADTRTPNTGINASGAANTTASPAGVSTGVNAGGGASSSAPVSGSAWGGADANAQASTPDAKQTVREVKGATRNKVDGLENKRDKLEERSDKKVDKALQ